MILRMLREAGLLAQAYAHWEVIQRPYCRRPCCGLISADNRRWLAGFLVPDAEIGGL